MPAHRGIGTSPGGNANRRSVVADQVIKPIQGAGKTRRPAGRPIELHRATSLSAERAASVLKVTNPSLSHGAWKHCSSGRRTAPKEQHICTYAAAPGQ